MKGIIRHFSNCALDAFKDLSNSMNAAINSFNFDDLDKMVSNAQKSLDKATEKLKSRFSDTPTNFTVNIPYDRDTDDCLTTRIEDGQFIVTVEKRVDKENNKTENKRQVMVYIPDDVDVHSMKRHYDDASHKMFFVFDKKTEK